MSLPIHSKSHMSSLEGFLLADIGSQPNGLPLTILSLLARAGLDPWVEAERLSHMSKPAAASYMIAAISRARVSSRTPADISELANGLVARLPSDEPMKLLGVTATGTGFEGIPMVALMVAFYAILTLGLLALLLERG